MLGPEEPRLECENESKSDYVEVPSKTKAKTVPAEGTSSVELNSFRNPKSWKKSISNFFRNQLRSTKSNDGDLPSTKDENFEADISPEQKWQSLGKVFRRQSFAEHWSRSPNQQGELPNQNKRLAVRKVFSTYFGKSQQKTSNAVDK